MNESDFFWHNLLIVGGPPDTLYLSKASLDYAKAEGLWGEAQQQHRGLFSMALHIVTSLNIPLGYGIFKNKFVKLW